MILLRLISWPYIRKHLLRTVLTTAGIVLGVALLVGMQSANRSVMASFNQTVDRIAGKAQLQVSAGESGFAEEVLEKIQSMPEVQNAAPVIEAVVDTGLAGEGKLLILAVDMTGDSSLRDYDFDNGQEDAIEDPLIFLAQPDSLIVTREFAVRNGLATGSRISFRTMDGPKNFTVRGILKAGGMASAFGGSLGIMDIYAAQKVFGRGRRFDRVDLRLREGVVLAQGQSAIARAMGEGFDVEPPSGRGRQFESLLGIYTLAMSISSLFALFIGLFIIYNSFAIAVTQRRSEIGILRALGATRGQIRTLFLGESAIAGVIGSAAGVAVGLAFTRSLTGATGTLMETMFGVPANTRDILIPWWFLLGAFAAGVATSMIAALIPARSAARLEPIQALQKGRYQVLGAGENRMRRNIALTALAIAAVCFPLSSYRPVFYAGALLTVVAGLLLTPFLSLALARVLRYPLKWLRPVEGSLAADSLIQAPRRTSATVAALMLSLALAIAQGGVSLGSVKSISEWMTGTLNPDLFVNASQVVAAHDFRFPASMEAELAQIPGVAEVQPVRTTRVKYGGQPIMVVAADEAKIAKRIRRVVISGDLATMDRAAAHGAGVLIAENLANLQKIKLGDTFEIAAPVAPLRLPVVGIVRDYSNQLGTVFVDRKVYVKHFNDDTIDIFRVYLKPGASPEEARKNIQDRLGGQRRLFVLLNHEVRTYVLNAVNQWLGMTYLQVGVALIVGILGIINTLTVSISDRRRELGVLRAVGGLRAQIRGTVWLESMAIGAIGLLLGIGTGALFLYYELETIGKDLAGTPLTYEFPFGITAILLPVILAASVISAILPGETAVRSSLVEALEYE